MNYDETIKLAYGIGCIATLKRNGVDPEAFCKTAVQTDVSELHKMAEAIASVYRAGDQPQQAQYAEKVASAIFE